MQYINVQCVNLSMNFLKGTRGYLAGNLENVTGQEFRDWREWFEEEMLKINIFCFNPCETVLKNFPVEHESFQKQVKGLRAKGDFDELNRLMKDVRRRDLAMVDKCDFVVANINPDKPTWGTTEELAMAIRMNKPIYLVINGGLGLKNIPLWVAGMVRPECWYETLDEVVENLRKIDSGEIKLCTKEWRLLEDKFLTIPS